MRFYVENLVSSIESFLRESRWLKLVMIEPPTYPVGPSQRGELGGLSLYLRTERAELYGEGRGSGSLSKCRRRSPCEKDIVSARPELAKVLCRCLIKTARLQFPKTNFI